MVRKAIGRLVRGLFGRERVDAARAGLAAWRRHRALPVARGAWRAESAWLRGHADAAEREWKSLAAACPGDPLWPERLSEAANLHADYARAEQVVVDAQARGAASDTLDLLAEHYGRFNRRSNSAEDEALAQVDAPTISPLRLFQSAVYLSSIGRIAEARAGLSRLMNHRRMGVGAAAQLRALDLLEAAQRDKPIDIPGWLSPARSSALVREPGADTLVVAFMPPGGLFGVPVNALHAILTPARTHALYLYDSRGLYHLAGTDRFGPGYAAMLGGIRTLSAELGSRRLVTLGLSAAGFTALRAGLDLNADRVIGFAPVSSLAQADMETDARMPAQRQRVLAHLADFTRDLIPEFQASPCRPAITIYYGSGNPQDRWHAERFGQIAGADLRPLPGLASHDPVGHLLLTGREGEIADLVAVPPRSR